MNKGKTTIISTNYPHKYNVVNSDDQLIYDERNIENWFDNAFYLYNCNGKTNYVSVKLNGKWNILKNDGTFLTPDQWYDDINSQISENCIIVTIRNKSTFLSLDGKLLFNNLWFHSMSPFFNGWARVCDYGNKTVNLINKDGKLFSNKWYDEMSSINFKTAVIRQNEKWNFMNSNGEILYKPNTPNEWFDMVDETPMFRKNNGMGTIMKDGKWNFFDTAKKKIIYAPDDTSLWFSYVGNFVHGFGLVKNYYEKWNYIDAKGDFLYKKENFPFTEAYNFSIYGKDKGTASVKMNGNWYRINRQGELLP